MKVQFYGFIGFIRVVNLGELFYLAVIGGATNEGCLGVEPVVEVARVGEFRINTLPWARRCVLNANQCKG